jgi:hypothetical protein
MATTQESVKQSGAKQAGVKEPGAKQSGAKQSGVKEPSKNGTADQRPRTLGDAAGSIAGTFESAAAEKAESAVSGRGFATLLGWVTENVIAVTRIGSDVADLAVRNLRLAGRKDLARLGIQQARTEDKLERLLAEVESLEAELRRSRGTGAGSAR